MSFIHDNIAAIFSAVTVCALAWMYGGTMSETVISTVPWLCAILAEVMICFPQRHPGEPTSHARERVWRAMKKDPLVWLSAAFLILLCIPFTNRALCPGCDADLIAQGFSADPPVKFLPSCVDRMHHLNVFLWFLPSILAMTTARHSLTRSGRRTLVEIIVWNAAILGVLGFVQQVAEAPGPLWSDKYAGMDVHFFSTFGYPNMGGDYFTIMFCMSVAVWMWKSEDVRVNVEKTELSRLMSRHKLFWMKNTMLIPSLLCFFSAMSSLSRAGIILVSSAAVILSAHAAATTLSRMKKADRVRAAAFCMLGLILLAVLASAFMPDGIRREMSTVNTAEALDRVTGRSEAHTHWATLLWKERPVFGFGGHGYAHFMPLKAIEEGHSETFGAGSANVHNDYMQFLVEHGTTGLLCLAAIVALLLAPVCSIWKRLAKAARFLPRHRQPPPPQALFALPGAAFAMLVAAAVPLVHAFGDCPFRSPAVMSAFFVALACTTGFLPHEDDGESQPD